MSSRALIMSNFDPLQDSIIFSSDRGSWNVSRALRDCLAGQHRCWRLDVEECYAHNSAVEVDEEKVKRFMRTPEVFSNPCIAVMEDGACWFIDGHHRLRALHRLGIKEFAAWVIDDATRYIVWYNGKRVM